MGHTVGPMLSDQVCDGAGTSAVAIVVAMSDQPRQPQCAAGEMSAAARCSCAALALIGLVVGCTERPPQRVVHVRVADQMYAAEAPLAASTALYPRRTVGDETRVVLRGRTSDERMGQAPIAIEVDVPAGGVLEFGYGLGEVEEGASVEFSVAALTAGKNVDLFRTLLDARRGDEKQSANGWHDARVEMEGLSGRVRLEFLAVSDRMATTGKNDGVPPCGFFSAPVVTRPSREEAPPNVLLISLDTLRADRLGIYGYGKNTSPNIDRVFGKSGVVVERLYSTAADTLLGHAAMLTGLRPSTALTSPVAGHLGSWENTLAEMFSARGYRTGAFTEDAWVSAPFGFWRGFERYAEERSAPGLSDTSGHSREIFAKGLEWLQANAGQPTFLFLHTYEVHYPYTPRGEITPEDSSQRALDSATYDGEIRYLDEQLGNFLAALDDRKLSRSTIVVVTADHGEEFGEHGRRYHGTNLHDEVLHVPALFLAPGRLPAGVRRSGPLAQVDIMPTILDLAGIRSPPDLDGQSFAAFLRDGAAPPPRVMYHEAVSDMVVTYGASAVDWLPPSYALTKWPYRLIRSRTREGHRCELFDLAADPAETDNIYEAMKDRFVAEREELDRYEETNAARRQALSSGLAKGSAAAEPQPAEVDPKVKEKLRALGYFE